MNADKQTNENGLARTWAGGMAIAAGLIRLIPYHPWNFTPVGAVGLFGGARLRSWWAYILPLGVMAVSDLLLWWINGQGYNPFNPWVYASFFLAVLWGRLLLRNAGPGRIAAASVLVSVQFFLLTNFGVWFCDFLNPQPMPESTAVVWEESTHFKVLSPHQYAPNLSGLLACYAAALPFTGTAAPPLGFFGNQLLGDLFYSGLLFGVYAWLRSGVLVPRRPREVAAAKVQ
jgi:hypothetical protein